MSGDASHDHNRCILGGAYRMHLTKALSLAALLAVTLSASPPLTGTAVAPLGQSRLDESADVRVERPLHAARRLASQLAARGLLSVPVRFVDRDLGQFNAHAEYDFASATCRVTLDASRFGGSAYRTPLAFRYLVYHELSHCEWYARPGVFAALTEGDERAARMLDDLLLFDAVDAPEDRLQLNLFAFAHEVYADVRAVALLANEGVPAEELAFTARLREVAAFDLHHGTAAAIDAVLAGHGAPLHADALERRVRAVAARFIAQSQLRLIFSANDTLPQWLWQLLRSRRTTLLQAGVAAAQSAPATPGPPSTSADASPLWGDAAAHPERLGAYRSLQWWYRTVKRARAVHGVAAAGAGGDARVAQVRQVDAWMADSYGPDPQQVARAAARVLASLLPR